MQLNKEQAGAVAQVLDWAAKHPRFLSLQGAAGTGKTTVIGEVLPKLRARFKEVILTGITGKAALRLSEVASYPATTLHKKLYLPPGDESQELSFEALNPAPEGCLLVVDEASMVTPDVWGDLLKWVEGGVAVLLVGDGYQLPPVISPAQAKIHGDSYSVFAHVPGPALRQVMRSGDDILAVATRLREEQKVTRETRGGYSYLVGKLAREVAERHAAMHVAGHDAALITWRNETRMRLCALTRACLGRDPLDSSPGVGEPIMFCRNGFGFMNGEIGIVSELTVGPQLGPVETRSLVVRGHRYQRALVTLGGRDAPMDGGQAFLAEDDWRQFVRDKRALKMKGDPTPITWGYVLTAHKAQGSEFDAVTVFLEGKDGASKPFLAPSRLPDGTSVPFWCRWMYTALTRAKKSCALVMGS